MASFCVLIMTHLISSGFNLNDSKRLELAEKILRWYARPENWSPTLVTNVVGSLMEETYTRGDLGHKAREYFQFAPRFYKGKEAVEAEGKICPDCGGSGHRSPNTCERCNGSGRIKNAD